MDDALGGFFPEANAFEQSTPDTSDVTDTIVDIVGVLVRVRQRSDLMIPAIFFDLALFFDLAFCLVWTLTRASGGLIIYTGVIIIYK